MAEPHQVTRTVVLNHDGTVVSDSGPYEPTPEEIGDGVAETLTDLANLARQTGRVAGKVSRIAKMVGAVVGPLDRPLPERAATEGAKK